MGRGTSSGIRPVAKQRLTASSGVRTQGPDRTRQEPILVACMLGVERGCGEASTGRLEMEGHQNGSLATGRQSVVSGRPRSPSNKIRGVNSGGRAFDRLPSLALGIARNLKPPRCSKTSGGWAALRYSMGQPGHLSATKKTERAGEQAD
jgi:hypothetical protein